MILLFFILNIIFFQNYNSNYVNVNEMFKKFLIKYNKTYLDEKEYLNHLKIFNKSLNIINNHNKNHSFNLSINKFSDLT